MMEITKAIDPALHRSMEETTQFADRVGAYGCNLYYCQNYTAPVHTDLDAVTRCICANIQYNGNPEWDEFAFCQPDRGYYIDTSKSNVLW